MDLADLTDDPEDPQHTPQERAAAASRSTWVSVAVNLALTVTQVVLGVLSKSQGLVADGIHSLSDLVADFVVLFASHHAKKDADEDHPYGHQRFETAASLVLGGLLLARSHRCAHRRLHGGKNGVGIRLGSSARSDGPFRGRRGSPGDSQDLDRDIGGQERPRLADPQDGDMIVVDAHIEVDASISVEAGHDIAVDARQRVLHRHRVLNLMTHVDPWRRLDLDHPEPTAAAGP